MGRLFGTDGVRGVAGEDLTGQLAMDLAAAAAGLLQDARTGSAAQPNGARLVAVVGRDPRASGEFLEAAVVAGLAGAGVDVLRLGVIPTPGVAHLTAELGADLGIMLSASHNPAADNGIKLFARGGFKLPDAAEDEIEARLAEPGRFRPGPPAGGFGRVRNARGERERYLAHLLASLMAGAGEGAAPLAGLRVVVDCAHGAASELAPALLRRAGADVIAIGAEPDGENINAGCGSTHLETLSAAVLKHGADAGIAHDGDADRCLAVDADGQVIDGDQILAVLALGLKARNRLAGDTVVTTVMSNLGFRLAMAEAGITVVETAVGDRYVLEAMRAGHFVLGGEQSGHIIMLDHATTGDGLLTALHLLAAAAAEGVPLAGLARVMTRYPQVLVNVTGVDKARAAESPELAAAVAAAEAELGTSGRVLVRPSGTEPTVRIMVEAKDPGHANRLAEALAATVRAVSLPGPVSSPGLSLTGPVSGAGGWERVSRAGCGRGREGPGGAWQAWGVILGIGVDLVDISRLDEALRRTPALASRLFTEGERGAPPASLAACFAAKEAVAKALGGPAGLRWADVEVGHDQAGRPELALRGTVADAAGRLGVRRWHVSLTHDSGVSVAFVVAEA